MFTISRVRKCVEFPLALTVFLLLQSDREKFFTANFLFRAIRNSLARDPLTTSGKAAEVFLA